MKERLCCCIPDQTREDLRCTRLAEYQIWMGDDPTPDAYTESCSVHLEQMLDDSVRFEVLRIPPSNNGVQPPTKLVGGILSIVEECAQIVEFYLAKYPISVFPQAPAGQHGATVDSCSASALRAVLPFIAEDIRRCRLAAGAQ